jgi:hypothetical protein
MTPTMGSATVTKRPKPAVMRKALLTERFGPIDDLVRERAEAGTLLTERFGPIDELVHERPVKVRPVKRPKPAVQPPSRLQRGSTR